MRGFRSAIGVLAGFVFLAPAARAASPAVAAAETVIRLDASFMHTQYHENAPEGAGDDESGYNPGFGVGVSALLPGYAGDQGDLYTSLGYDFGAGDIHYGGHYLYGNAPLSATDNAVFNRIEARIGLGAPIANGAELIAYVAGGYQAWNRNINVKGQIGTDELYRAGLVGGGVKFDQPLTPSIVLSLNGEFLAVVGGNVRADQVGFSGAFGPSGEEIVSLGIDDRITPRWHSFATVYFEHFNYAGSKPTIKSQGFYEPLSTTTDFGANLGVGYSFN